MTEEVEESISPMMNQEAVDYNKALFEWQGEAEKITRELSHKMETLLSKVTTGTYYGPSLRDRFVDIKEAGDISVVLNKLEQSLRSATSILRRNERND